MTIAIVGGGIMGLSAAFHLRRAEPGIPVTVFERDCVGAAASGASAAGVRAMGRDPAERALALASLARWPDLGHELEGDTCYRRDGGVRIAIDEAAWSAVPDWVAAQRADGVPLEILDEHALHQLVPGLSPECVGGVYALIDGQAEAMPTVRAFADAARRLGARIEDGADIQRVVTERGRVVAVERADGTGVSCDVAIVTAGAWSATLLAPLGIELPLHTRALQMLLTAPAPPMLTQVLGCFERHLSLKQLRDGAYLIGGGWPALITDEDDNRWEVLDASVRASREIASAVYPAAGAARLARSWAGLEAFTPDEIPLIGPVRGIEGLLVAAGFCGHGFALSPAVGDILARLALGRDAHDHLWRGLRVDRVTREAMTS